MKIRQQKMGKSVLLLLEYSHLRSKKIDKKAVEDNAT